jgi:hypothetical protein
MKTILATPLVVSLAIAAAEAGPPFQWSTGAGGNGHWYRVVDETCTDWASAKAAAEAVGAHLATIGSIEEHRFVRELSPFFAVWIGLYQDRAAPDFSEPAGGWRWVTGEPLAFTNWYQPEEPNNINRGEDFGHMNAPWLAGGQWNDHRGEACFAYAIEWSADCNADGVVDFGQIRNGQLTDGDSDGVPDCCEAGTECIVNACPGDVTGNGGVDPIDLTALLVGWGTDGDGEFDSDRNDDGIVDADDLLIVLAGWGPCP